MGRFRTALAAILIAGFAAGPVSAAAPANTTTAVAPATLQGTVRDEQGLPVRGAKVSLSGPKTYTTTTDAAGSFSIANILQGNYRATVEKPGYAAANEPNVIILAGSSQTLTVSLVAATLTSLRTIASVRSVGAGTFNTSTASINVVTNEVFQDQAQPQVTRVLNEIPGVQISLPSSSANAAVPGAITFPNIRASLSYETASLIDGHPVSVGQFGDYVTTFLNSFLLGNVEIVKGPGAMSPQTNYAIGGTVNFRTKDPSSRPTPDYSFGFDNHGGTYTNFGFSDTVGRLGFVVDLATINSPSAVNGQGVFFDPTTSGAVCKPGVTDYLSATNPQCFVLFSSRFFEQTGDLRSRNGQQDQ